MLGADLAGARLRRRAHRAAAAAGREPARRTRPARALRPSRRSARRACSPIRRRGRTCCSRSSARWQTSAARATTRRLRMLASGRLLKDAAQVAVPTAVWVGAQDRITPPANARARVRGAAARRAPLAYARNRRCRPRGLSGTAGGDRRAILLPRRQQGQHCMLEKTKKKRGTRAAPISRRRCSARCGSSAMWPRATPWST